MNHDGSRNNIRFFSGLYPVKRPCGARTRAGTPCKKWAMKGRTRCLLHGGRSTGPTSEAGLQNSKTARLKHGKYKSNLLKKKLLLKVLKLHELRYGKRMHPAQALSLWQHLKTMPWLEFRERRKRFMVYYRKEKRKLLKKRK
jgi:hypothetical protein